MSITKNLVMLMDGKIYVNSKENEGTTFTVDIPLLKKESETKILDFGNMGLNALVVDDEEEECRHATRVLQEIKIQAEWAVSYTHLIDNLSTFCITDHNISCGDSEKSCRTGVHCLTVFQRVSTMHL